MSDNPEQLPAGTGKSIAIMQKVGRVNRPYQPIYVTSVSYGLLNCLIYGSEPAIEDAEFEIIQPKQIENGTMDTVDDHPVLPVCDSVPGGPSLIE